MAAPSTLCLACSGPEVSADSGPTNIQSPSRVDSEHYKFEQFQLGAIR
jgi:hypothetical protein